MTDRSGPGLSSSRSDPSGFLLRESSRGRRRVGQAAGRFSRESSGGGLDWSLSRPLFDVPPRGCFGTEPARFSFAGSSDEWLSIRGEHTSTRSFPSGTWRRLIAGFSLRGSRHSLSAASLRGGCRGVCSGSFTAEQPSGPSSTEVPFGGPRRSPPGDHLEVRRRGVVLRGGLAEASGW